MLGLPLTITFFWKWKNKGPAFCIGVDTVPTFNDYMLGSIYHGAKYVEGN
jgi:hypothetical protein